MMFADLLSRAASLGEWSYDQGAWLLSSAMALAPLAVILCWGLALVWLVRWQIRKHQNKARDSRDKKYTGSNQNKW